MKNRFFLFLSLILILSNFAPISSSIDNANAGYSTSKDLSGSGYSITGKEKVRILLIGETMSISIVKAVLEKHAAIELITMPKPSWTNIAESNPDCVLIDKENYEKNEYRENYTFNENVKIMLIDFEEQEITILNRSTRSIHSQQDLIDLLLIYQIYQKKNKEKQK